MANEQLAREIARAFSPMDRWPNDEFIVANTDPMWLEASAGLSQIVPAYMSWCARHALEDGGSLVPDHTIRALAEYGRSKDATITHLNFKHTCSDAQCAVVAEFLHWCLSSDLIVDEQQVRRALKYWAPQAQGGVGAV